MSLRPSSVVHPIYYKDHNTLNFWEIEFIQYFEGVEMGSVNLSKDVLERVLLDVNINDILSMNQVCRKYKELYSSLEFWMKYYNHNGRTWDVPARFMKSSKYWILFYMNYKYRIFSQNILGLHKFAFEEIMSSCYFNAASCKTKEITALDIPELYFIVRNRGSFDVQIILNLNEIGLTPTVARLSMPFKLCAGFKIIFKEGSQNLKISLNCEVDCAGEIYFNEKFNLVKNFTPDTEYQNSLLECVFSCKNAKLLEYYDAMNLKFKISVEAIRKKSLFKGKYGIIPVLKLKPSK